MALGGTLLGVVLDLIGILFSTSGNLLIRWVANRDEKKIEANPEYKKKKEYLDPLWYLIVILLFGNGAIDFAAFQFATMTILAPLASVSIVFNSIVAYFLLGEKFTFLHGVGSLIMICGATLTVITGPPEAEHQVTVYTVWEFFIREQYLAFLGGKVVLLALCVVYINFVPVVELQKHPTDKAKTEKAARAEAISNRTTGISVVSPSTPNIVTIHEDGTTSEDSGKLTIHPQHTYEELEPNSPATPDSESTRSRQNSSTPMKEQDRLVRTQCHCPSTPRSPTSEISPRANSPLTGSSSGMELAPTIRRPLWQRFLYTQGHIVIWAFLVSGIGSYTNLFGKIAVKLIAASGEGNMQFTHWGAYLLVLMLVVAAVTQLHLMKVCLARFESIVIMPSLNCMYILHLMCEGGMFFNEFGHFTSELYKGLFALSIIIAFIGIAVASQVKEQSLDAQVVHKAPMAAELEILASTPKSPAPMPMN